MAHVAVFGAAGRQGMAQVKELLAAGHTVRAYSRRSDPFLGEAFAGVEVVPADIADEAGLPKAMEGCDGVFYTHPLRAPIDRVEALARIGKAAKEAQVGRVVWNTSSWIPDKPGEVHPTYHANTLALNALWRSGAPGTVFGSVLFMDNLLTNWAFPFITREGRYVYAHRPDMASNWICLDDVAKFMIAALDRPDLEGAWLNIGGPERLLPTEVAERLSTVTGRQVVYDRCSEDEFGRLLADAFGDELTPEAHAAIAENIAGFYRFNNESPVEPFAVDMEPVLARIPIKLTTFSEWMAKQDWRPSNAPRPPGG
jgi:uncharacterized protein YbjT (DUF2867 family)